MIHIERGGTEDFTCSHCGAAYEMSETPARDSGSAKRVNHSCHPYARARPPPDRAAAASAAADRQIRLVLPRVLARRRVAAARRAVAGNKATANQSPLLRLCL